MGGSRRSPKRRGKAGCNFEKVVYIYFMSETPLQQYFPADREAAEWITATITEKIEDGSVDVSSRMIQEPYRGSTHPIAILLEGHRDWFRENLEQGHGITLHGKPLDDVESNLVPIAVDTVCLRFGMHIPKSLLRQGKPPLHIPSAIKNPYWRQFASRIAGLLGYGP